MERPISAFPWTSRPDSRVRVLCTVRSSWPSFRNVAMSERNGGTPSSGLELMDWIHWTARWRSNVGLGRCPGTASNHLVRA